MMICKTVIPYTGKTLTKKPRNFPTNLLVLRYLDITGKTVRLQVLAFISFPITKYSKKRIVIRERISTIARGGGEARRGSGFPAALYPNPGFGNGMRRTQVNTNASNDSTGTGLVGGGEQPCVK